MFNSHKETKLTSKSNINKIKIKKTQGRKEKVQREIIYNSKKK